MKTLYVSDDGKYFTDLEECRAHEKALNNTYYVEIIEDGICVSRNTYPNKQKCQHAVAGYIHGICAEMKCIEKYDSYIITVRHKNRRCTSNLSSLIEKVPEHYKIDSTVFDELIH